MDLANLTERFVWGKKIEKELVSGRDVREMTAKAEMRRQAERLVGAGRWVVGAGLWVLRRRGWLLEFLEVRLAGGLEHVRCG